MQDDHKYMQAAMEEAHAAAARDEVPIGAVLVCADTGKIAASAGNRTRELSDPTAHAEILAIREVCKARNAQRIPEYHLYVTLEPCAMCAAAIAFARIPRLVYAAVDTKGGGVEHGARFFEQPTCHHKIETASGLMANESAALLKNFFAAKRL